jgi:hypothetical protein
MPSPVDAGNAPGAGPLRPGGQSVSDIASPEANLPSTPSKSAAKQAPALTLMRDVVDGPEKVRACGATYLPKAPGEDAANYTDRLNRSVFFNVTGRTVDGLVGQIFRKDPILSEDVPAVMRAQWENLDLAGTHGDVFVRELATDAETAGHAAILVEFPRTDGTQHYAAELSGEIRPYWVPIQKDNIVSWRTAVIQGKTVLTQVVLKECTMVPDGLFGEKEQTQYRVFFRNDTRTDGKPKVGWALLEVTKNKTLIKIDQGYYPTQDEIPIAEIITSGRKGIFESVPPLLDLAYLNIAHYQLLSDTLTSLHTTCVPFIFAAGFESLDQNGNPAPFVIGPSTALVTVNAQAKAEYVSHDGAAIGSCQTMLDSFKSDMGTIGLQMLAPQKRSAETLGAKQLDKSTEDSALAVTARGLQDGIERAMGFHAKYLGLPTGGSIVINREFDSQAMAADLLTAYVGAVRDAGLPPRILLDAMQQHDALPLPEGQTVDDVLVEMEARQAAEAEQQRQAAADALALKQQAQQTKAVA